MDSIKFDVSTVITMSWLNHLGRNAFEMEHDKIEIFAHPEQIVDFFSVADTNNNMLIIPSDKYKDVYKRVWVTVYGNTVHFIGNPNEPFKDGGYIGYRTTQRMMKGE